jgi:hypothetical protein
LADNDAWNTGMPKGAQSPPGPDPAARWSIGADLLPVHRRLSLLAQAIQRLFQRYARSEAEWREWSRLISATNDYPGRIPDPETLGLAELEVARLYPANPESFTGRAWINDSPMIPRIQMQGNDDYGRALTRHWRSIGEKGFLLLEWDLAIDASDYLQMCAYVYSDPQSVWAAPYFLYYPGDSLILPSQVPDFEGVSEEGDVAFVPFGCTYLPSWVLRRMAESGADAGIVYPSPDHLFNVWANSLDPPVRRRLAYWCRPRHLHYGTHVSMVPGGPDLRPPK